MIHSDTSYSEPDFPLSAERKLIFLVGVPGAGKTQWRQEFLRRNPDERWAVVSPDEIRYDYANRHGLTYQKTHDDMPAEDMSDKDKKRYEPVHAPMIRQLVAAQMRDAIGSNRHVMIDMVNASREGRDALWDQMEDMVEDIHGQYVDHYFNARAAVVLLIGEEEAVRRNQQRFLAYRPWSVLQDITTHYVPEAVVRASFSALQKDIPKRHNGEDFTLHHYIVSDAYRRSKPTTLAFIKCAERGGCDPRSFGR